MLVRAGPFSLIGGRGPRAEALANGLVAAIAPAISTLAPAKTPSTIANLFIGIDTAVRYLLAKCSVRFVKTPTKIA